MPTAYTPGLRISEDTLVRKERRLPVKGEVLTAAGAMVEPQTIVARALLEGNIYSFKAAEQLGLSASELLGLLKKKVGDPVEAGEILGESKGLFGLFRTQLKAPVAGTIEHISSVSGYIGLRQPPRPVEVRAYVRGKIIEVLPQEGVIIESRAALVQGIFGVGGEGYGQLRSVCPSPQEPLTEARISEDLKGAIIVGGSVATRGALQKAASVGVSGVVVGGVPDATLREFVGYDIGVAVTGQEKVPFTLLLTEGFGEIPMAAKTFALLQSLEGKIASINGATQIRAGVIRPEIIVPTEEAAQEKPAAAGESSQLAVGVKVRMIREPYFGKLGEVVELPSGLQEIQTGAKVRVAAVKLEAGGVAVVPRPNLEIIQE